MAHKNLKERKIKCSPFTEHVGADSTQWVGRRSNLLTVYILHTYMHYNINNIQDIATSLLVYDQKMLMQSLLRGPAQLNHDDDL